MTQPIDILEWWTWFLDDEPRNDIAKHSKKELSDLIESLSLIDPK